MNFGYRSTFFLIDKGNIEVFGPLGLAYWLKLYAKVASNQQSGLLAHYTFAFVVSLFAIVCLLSVSFFDVFLGSSNVIFCLILSYVAFTLIVP
jgi:hypothetical protein